MGIALLAVITACADSSQPNGAGSDDQPVTLTGTSWVLDEVSIDGAMTAAVDSGASINFDADSQLYGSTGCNRFTGTWSQEGDTLTVQTGATTMMACSPDLQKQEEAVLGALAASNGFSVVDDRLTLLADTDPVAVYRTAVTDLAGTSWTATGVNNGNGAVVTTSLTADLTLTFAEDGKVSGFGGCSEFEGAYVTDGAGIAITDLSAAAPTCTDATATTAQQEYLAAMAAASNFSIDGTRLDLRDESGALQVGFSSVS